MDLQASSWKVISIFISSTFLDMDTERDYLKSFVIPRLETEFSQEHLSFQVIDLRWGVMTKDLKQEEEKQAAVLNVCFNEIKRSRPYFIGLIGARYGWIPPYNSVRKVMDRLSDDELALLNQTEDVSITELEMEYGALGSKEMLRNSLFYFREDTSYEGMNESSLLNFSDAERFRDTDAATKLNEKLKCLKGKIQKRFRDAGLTNAVKSYRLQWENDKFIGLDAWGETVFHDLKAKIEANELGGRKKLVRNEYEQEEDLLNGFITKQVNLFAGREKEMEDQVSFCQKKLETEFPTYISSGHWWDGFSGGFMADIDYLEKNLKYKLLVGDSGYGKSSLFSMIYHRMQQELPDNAILLGHSAGMSPEATHLYTMLGRFCYLLAKRMDVVYEVPKQGNLSTTEYTYLLRNEFDELCRKAVKRKLLVAIFIDAIDRFVDENALSALSCLIDVRRIETDYPRKEIFDFENSQKPTHINLFWGSCTTEYYEKKVQPFFNVCESEDMEVEEVVNEEDLEDDEDIEEDDEDIEEEEDLEDEEDDSPSTFFIVDRLEDFSQSDAAALLDKVLAKAGKSLPSEIREKLLGKRNASGKLACSSPLWMVVATNILAAIDGYDFSLMRQTKGLNEEDQITVFLAKMINDFSGDPAALFLQLVEKAKSRFGERLVDGALSLIALSQHGLSDRDLESLLNKDWNAINFAAFRRWFSSLIQESDVHGTWTFSHQLILDTYKQRVQPASDYYLQLFNHSRKERSADNPLYYLFLSGNTELIVEYLKEIATDEQVLLNTLQDFSLENSQALYDILLLLVYECWDSCGEGLPRIIEKLKLGASRKTVQLFLRNLSLERKPIEAIKLLRFIWVLEESLSCEERMERWQWCVQKLGNSISNPLEIEVDRLLRFSLNLSKGQLMEVYAEVQELDEKGFLSGQLLEDKGDGTDELLVIVRAEVVLACSEILFYMGQWERAKGLCNLLVEQLRERMEQSAWRTELLIVLVRACEKAVSYVSIYQTWNDKFFTPDDLDCTYRLQDARLQLFSTSSFPLDEESGELLTGKHAGYRSLMEDEINSVEEWESAKEYQESPLIVFYWTNFLLSAAENDRSLVKRVPQEIRKLQGYLNTKENLTDAVSRVYHLCMGLLTAFWIKEGAQQQDREKLLLSYLKSLKEYLSLSLPGVHGIHLTCKGYNHSIGYDPFYKELSLTPSDVQHEIQHLSKKEDEETRLLCAIFYLCNQRNDKAMKLVNPSHNRSHFLIWLYTQLPPIITEDEVKEGSDQERAHLDRLIHIIQTNKYVELTQEEKVYLLSSLYLYRASTYQPNIWYDFFSLGESGGLRIFELRGTPAVGRKTDLQKAQQWLDELDGQQWNDSLKEVALLLNILTAVSETTQQYYWVNPYNSPNKVKYVAPNEIQLAFDCCEEAKRIWHGFETDPYATEAYHLIPLTDAILNLATGKFAEAVALFHEYLDGFLDPDQFCLNDMLAEILVVEKRNFDAASIWNNQTLTPEEKADKLVEHNQDDKALLVLLEEIWSWEWKEDLYNVVNLIYRYRIFKKAILLGERFQEKSDPFFCGEDAKMGAGAYFLMLVELDFNSLCLATLICPSEKIRLRIRENWLKSSRCNELDLPRLTEEETALVKEMVEDLRLHRFTEFIEHYQDQTLDKWRYTSWMNQLHLTYEQMLLSEAYWNTPRLLRLFKKKQKRIEEMNIL